MKITSPEKEIYTIPCIVCGQSLKSILEDGNQPIDGLSFSTYGHYGTTFFDPMDGTSIEINICDQCLEKNKEKIKYNKEKNIDSSWSY